MPSVEDRGIKRRCQNEECAMPFYDLNRQTFDCPNCGSGFDLEGDKIRNGNFVFGSTMPPQWKQWSKLGPSPIPIVQDKVERTTEEPATEVDAEAEDSETDLSSDNLLDDDNDDSSTFVIRPGNLDTDSKS